MNTQKRCEYQSAVVRALTIDDTGIPAHSMLETLSLDGMQYVVEVLQEVESYRLANEPSVTVTCVLNIDDLAETLEVDCRSLAYAAFQRIVPECQLLGLDNEVLAYTVRYTQHDLVTLGVGDTALQQHVYEYEQYSLLKIASILHEHEHGFMQAGWRPVYSALHESFRLVPMKENHEADSKWVDTLTRAKELVTQILHAGETHE